MSKLLFLNASLGGEHSHSQHLAGEFINQWQQDFPGDTVIKRNLAEDSPPLINAAFAGALYKPASEYTPAESAIMAVSDTYVDELFAVDYLLIAAPVYNFTLPTMLKAYFDLVLRFGRTFESAPEGSRGLLGGRKVLVISARLGDYSPGSGREHFDHHEPYMRFVLERLGITDVSYVAASQNPMLHDETTRAAQMDQYREQVAAVRKSWSEARQLQPVS